MIGTQARERGIETSESGLLGHVRLRSRTSTRSSFGCKVSETFPETFTCRSIIAFPSSCFLYYSLYTSPQTRAWCSLVLDFIQFMSPLDDIVLLSAPSLRANISTHSFSLNDNSWIIFRSILTDSIALLALDFCFTLLDIRYRPGYVLADVRPESHIE